MIFKWRLQSVKCSNRNCHHGKLPPIRGLISLIFFCLNCMRKFKKSITGRSHYMLSEILYGYIYIYIAPKNFIGKAFSFLISPIIFLRKIYVFLSLFLTFLFAKLLSLLGKTRNMISNFGFLYFRRLLPI